jgi:hypothetical protein
MKKNLLAENYKRLFKARPSSNDASLLREAMTPKERKELLNLLLGFEKKLKSGIKLDYTDYETIGKFESAALADPGPITKVFFTFIDSDGASISIQKRALTMLLKVVNSSRKSGSVSHLSSSDKKYLKDIVMPIADGLASGEDMTDDIIDELGDLYDAVYATNDSVLIKAYDDLRSSADMGIPAQKKAVTAFMKILK